MNKITQDIFSCEDGLLHTDFNASPRLLESFFAEDFVEIDPQGKMQAREDVISWLREKDVGTRWELNDFQVQRLNEVLVLACYHAKQIVPEHSSKEAPANGSDNEPLNSISKGSMHSSIWRKHKAGWQMVFHQATKIQ